LYLADDKKDLAEQELLKAVELDPLNGAAHINLGNIYTQKNMFKEAECEFRKASMIKVEMDILYYCYGLLCVEEGRDKDAVNSWEKTLELNPNYLCAYRSLAAYYFINGNTVKTAYYSKQLKDKFSYSIDISSSVIMNKRGWLYSYSMQKL
jgi:Tfp pilus assembly protein PilF